MPSPSRIDHEIRVDACRRACIGIQTKYLAPGIVGELVGTVKDLIQEWDETNPPDIAMLRHKVAKIRSVLAKLGVK